MTAKQKRNDLELLSVVIPARDEEACIASTIEHLHADYVFICRTIVVVDDGEVTALEHLRTLKLASQSVDANTGLHGFGRAIIWGNGHTWRAVVIMMADQSDDVRDVVRDGTLNAGYDCAREPFRAGRRVVNYPWLNSSETNCEQVLATFFQLEHNDITNAFKVSKTTIDGCLTHVASPNSRNSIKSAVRIYLEKPPITCNRRSGGAKLKIKEMGSGYLLTCLNIGLKKICLRKSSSVLIENF
jgi:dolichol-phosphate mannosyltransferase